MRLAPVLVEKGVRTTVLLPDEPGNAAERLRNGGVEVVQLPLQRIRATSNLGTHLQFFINLPAQVRAIRELIKRLQIDVVQLNGLVNPHGAIAARGVGIPVVWQILDTYPPMLLRRLMGPLLQRYADVVMCTGKRVAAEHPGATKRPNQLVHFFPPVDLNCFTPNPAVRKQARMNLGIADTSLVIGTVGNINLQKGHDNFIRAAAHLKAKVPDARFAILGAMNENHRSYTEGLWALADQLGLQVGRDLFAFDPTGRVHELVQAMDVFWMTPRPRSEGIPTAMEEAMALALPVVSFDVGSIGELIEHGRTGYLVHDQDPKAVAEYTFDRLLERQVRTVMGNRGRQFVEEHASLEACANRHMKAYSLALRLGPDEAAAPIVKSPEESSSET
ncbi:glycosyl transferase, group 1 family protein [Nitrosococcus oceani AFC27]|nr:glycosyl transferase, group 1 family protein [Nitrosococcus oceani AFC27]